MGSRFLLLTQSNEALRGHKVHLRFGDELGERLQKELNADGASDTSNLSAGSDCARAGNVQHLKVLFLCSWHLGQPDYTLHDKAKVSGSFQAIRAFHEGDRLFERFEIARFAISSYEGEGRL